MGNTVVIPSFHDWYSQPLRKQKITLLNHHDAGQFFLVFEGKNSQNQDIIIKAYEYNQPLQNIKVIKDSINYFKKLSEHSVEITGIVNFAYTIQENMVFLFRPKFEKSFNFVEFCSYQQPTLEPVEKLFIFYQLYSIIKSLHDIGLAHGDLKPSNIFVNGHDLDLCIVDPAPFKPNFILESRLHVFYHYFTTSSDSGCYLAPERILGIFKHQNENQANEKNSPITNSQETKNEETESSEDIIEDYSLQNNFQYEDNQIDLKMADLFSFGCIIAFLYLDGEHIFDLSKLHKYANGKLDIRKYLAPIDDENIIEIIMGFISLDIGKRRETMNKLDHLFDKFFSIFSKLFCEFRNDQSFRIQPQEHMPKFEKIIHRDLFENGRLLLFNFFFDQLLKMDRIQSIIYCVQEITKFISYTKEANKELFETEKSSLSKNFISNPFKLIEYPENGGISTTIKMTRVIPLFMATISNNIGSPCVFRQCLFSILDIFKTIDQIPPFLKDYIDNYLKIELDKLIILNKGSRFLPILANVAPYYIYRLKRFVQEDSLLPLSSSFSSIFGAGSTPYIFSIFSHSMITIAHIINRNNANIYAKQKAQAKESKISKKKDKDKTEKSHKNKEKKKEKTDDEDEKKNHKDKKKAKHKDKSETEAVDNDEKVHKEKKKLKEKSDNENDEKSHKEKKKLKEKSDTETDANDDKSHKKKKKLNEKADTDTDDKDHKEKKKIKEKSDTDTDEKDHKEKKKHKEKSDTDTDANDDKSHKEKKKHKEKSDTDTDANEDKKKHKEKSGTDTDEKDHKDKKKHKEKSGTDTDEKEHKDKKKIKEKSDTDADEKGHKDKKKHKEKSDTDTDANDDKSHVDKKKHKEKSGTDTDEKDHKDKKKHKEKSDTDADDKEHKDKKKAKDKDKSGDEKAVHKDKKKAKEKSDTEKDDTKAHKEKKSKIAHKDKKKDKDNEVHKEKHTKKAKEDNQSEYDDIYSDDDFERFIQSQSQQEEEEKEKESNKSSSSNNNNNKESEDNDFQVFDYDTFNFDSGFSILNSFFFYILSVYNNNEVYYKKEALKVILEFYKCSKYNYEDKKKYQQVFSETLFPVFAHILMREMKEKQESAQNDEENELICCIFDFLSSLYQISDKESALTEASLDPVNTFKSSISYQFYSIALNYFKNTTDPMIKYHSYRFLKQMPAQIKDFAIFQSFLSLDWKDLPRVRSNSNTASFKKRVSYMNNGEYWSFQSTTSSIKQFPLITSKNDEIVLNNVKNKKSFFSPRFIASFHAESIPISHVLCTSGICVVIDKSNRVRWISLPRIHEKVMKDDKNNIDINFNFLFHNERFVNNVQQLSQIRSSLLREKVTAASIMPKFTSPFNCTSFLLGYDNGSIDQHDLSTCQKSRIFDGFNRVFLTSRSSNMSRDSVSVPALSSLNLNSMNLNSPLNSPIANVPILSTNSNVNTSNSALSLYSDFVSDSAVIAIKPISDNCIVFANKRGSVRLIDTRTSDSILSLAFDPDIGGVADLCTWNGIMIGVGFSAGAISMIDTRMFQPFIFSVLNTNSLTKIIPMNSRSDQISSQITKARYSSSFSFLTLNDDNEKMAEVYREPLNKVVLTYNCEEEANMPDYKIRTAIPFAGGAIALDDISASFITLNTQHDANSNKYDTYQSRRIYNEFVLPLETSGNENEINLSISVPMKAQSKIRSVHMHSGKITCASSYYDRNTNNNSIISCDDLGFVNLWNVTSG